MRACSTLSALVGWRSWHPFLRVPRPMTQLTVRGNFLRAIVESDVSSGRNGARVQTRFPPEPNGCRTHFEFKLHAAATASLQAAPYPPVDSEGCMAQVLAHWSR